MSSKSHLGISEEQFFYALLDKTKREFSKAPVFQKYGEARNWNCAVCETPIQKGKGVFFGLNWGGRDIDQQTAYPTKEREKGRNWPFAKHSREFFGHYFNEDIKDLNYSNLCFFRTPKASYLKAGDWRLAIPLFKEYVEYINPPWLVMLGSPKHLKREHLEIDNEYEVEDKVYNKRVWGTTGCLFQKYPIGIVPHSAAWCTKETHHKLWALMRNDLMKISL